MKQLILSINIALLIIVLNSCSNKESNQQSTSQKNSANTGINEEKLLAQAQTVFKALPDYAENPENEITPEKVALGKALYYDTHLSKNGNNSCNSCHNLATYGVDNKANSTGDAGKNGNRNSPTVLNAAFQSMQFWDGRAKNVEEQAGMPILNPVEMAIPDKAYLEKKLAGIKEYKELFHQAFPGDKNPVTYDHLQNAIAAFERTLVTPSRFDSYLKGNLSSLTTEEKHGLQTFIETGCSSCHNGVAVGGTMLQRFGTTTDYLTFTKSSFKDEGRKNVTKLDNDSDYFKVAVLRNIEHTYPYFHDGSISSLKEAIAIMGKAQLNQSLNEEQIASIEVFLKALTGNVPASALQEPKPITMR